jgi:hypothetical protein
MDTTVDGVVKMVNSMIAYGTLNNADDAVDFFNIIDNKVPVRIKIAIVAWMMSAHFVHIDDSIFDDDGIFVVDTATVRRNTKAAKKALHNRTIHLHLVNPDLVTRSKHNFFGHPVTTMIVTRGGR